MKKKDDMKIYRDYESLMARTVAKDRSLLWDRYHIVLDSWSNPFTFPNPSYNIAILHEKNPFTWITIRRDLTSQKDIPYMEILNDVHTTIQDKWSKDLPWLEIDPNLSIYYTISDKLVEKPDYVIIDNLLQYPGSACYINAHLK